MLFKFGTINKLNIALLTGLVCSNAGYEFLLIMSPVIMICASGKGCVKCKSLMRCLQGATHVWMLR